MNDLLILIALAVAPCIIIALFIYWRDKFDKEPFSLLVGSFFGGIASVVPAYFLSRGLEDIVLGGQSVNNFEIAIDAFICVAFAEEISKYFFLRFIAYPNKSFNEPFDGITYSVMVGMGFAMIENLLYVLGNNGNGIEVALLRMFTAIPAHAVFAVIMGYFVGLAKHSEHKAGYLFVGVMAAVLAHGFYDYFLFVQNIPFMYVGAAMSILFGLYLAFRAIKQHQKASPFVAKETNGDDTKITDSETGF
jgi:RsiW-degrading membrane proteinase PrsW (M82 family)